MTKKKSNGLKLAQIKDGVVIDHIGAGNSLKVLNNLKISAGYTGIVGLLMNVPSDKLDQKDVIKIENQTLGKPELYKIAVVAPYATVSFIKNYEVEVKVQIKSLQEIVLACSNMDCKSNIIINKEATAFSPTFLRTPGGQYICKHCGRCSYY